MLICTLQMLLILVAFLYYVYCITSTENIAHLLQVPESSVLQFYILYTGLSACQVYLPVHACHG